MTRVLAIAVALLLAGGALAADDAGAPEVLLSALHNATVQGDCARASELVRALERAGDAEALAVLGGRFENGRRCLGRDPARAAKLYRRAADDGEAVAMVRLGRLYAEGRGVAKDMASAALVSRRRARGGGARPGPPRTDPATCPRRRDAGPARPAAHLASPDRARRPGERVRPRHAHAHGRRRAQERGRGRASHGQAGRGKSSARLVRARPLAQARDRKERRSAFRHIEMAADQGYVPAMLDLAHRMGAGRGIERNDYSAYVGFLKARSKGADVHTELAQIEERLDYFEIRAAREQAIHSRFFPPIHVKD